MGLQGHVTDCSSESIPILLVAIIATCVSYLRTAVDTIIRFMGFSRIEPNGVEEGILGAKLGSGLAGLIVLAEQLNLNRAFSHRYGGEPVAGSDCVVCLSHLREGELVRRLPCRHVFHKECLDGWLDQLHFSCPLCRFPLVSQRRVDLMERRVSHDLVGFFSVQ